MKSQRTTDIWRGIERHGTGYRARVSQGRGLPRITRYFPPGTDPREMQGWRELTRASLHVRRKTRASRGTFEGDVKGQYLPAVEHELITYAERVREMDVWIAVFQTQRTDTITALQIRRQRNTWLTEPRAKDEPPLAPATVNKRLRALSNFFTVLSLDNPVKDVPEAKEPDPEPRALDYQTIENILACLPDVDRAKKGEKRGTVSATKIRLRCLAYCQLEPKQLKALTPTDLDLPNEHLKLAGREKGRGMPAVWVTLLPEAVSAFRDFAAHGLWGRFSNSSLRKSLKAAALNAGVTRNVRVKDLRHSYATLAMRALKSLEAVGKLLQHASPKTTQRYTLEAEAQVIAEHGRVVGQFKGATGAEKNRISLEFLGQESAPLVKIRPRKSKKLAV